MAKLFVSILQLVIPILLTELVRIKQKRDLKNASEDDIDRALFQVREATITAQDGKPLTPEQVKAMRDAYRNLVRA